MHFFQDNLPKDPSDFASGRGHCVPAPGEKSVDEAARAQDAPQTGPGTQEKSPGAGPGKTESPTSIRNAATSEADGTKKLPWQHARN